MMVKQLIYLTALVFLASARKTYVIKEKISNGEIKVMQPRVQSTTNEWCWFNNQNNKWCMTGDETWTLGYVNEYNFQEDDDTTNDIPANFLQTLDYQSTQDAAWESEFQLDRLIYHKLSFAMAEFVTGFRFELYYWIDSQAFCLNFVHTLEDVSISVNSESSVVQCSKKVIDCFDDWSEWTDEEAVYMECEQSSSSNVQVYSYIPVMEDQENYLLGYDEYIENFCWPGYSPWYSYFYLYPNNLQYAVSEMFYYIDEFLYDWTGARTAGYKSSEKKENPEVKSQSTGFNFYSAGQEIIKVFRLAIEHQTQSSDGEIKKANTLEELTDFTKKAFEKNKATRQEKK